MEESNRRTQIILFLVFIVLAFYLFCLLHVRKIENQQQHLHLITERNQHIYSVIYDQHKQLAATIHSEFLSRFDILETYQQLQGAGYKEKNRLRERMLINLGERYNQLQLETKVRQLHFHLSNNESFLRLHQPHLFGDNLTAVRDTVRYVNKEHQYIDGFEEGKVYNGYRFVFPITDLDQTHLGSMEISFGPEVFCASIMNQYLVLSNFYIKEDIVKKKVVSRQQETHYVTSPQLGYLYDKNVLEILQDVSHPKLDTNRPPQATLNILYRNAHSNKPMSYYDSSCNAVFTTIPIANPITKEMNAFLTIRSQSDLFLSEERHFRVGFLLSLVLLALFITFFYMQQTSKKKFKVIARQQKHQKERLAEAQKIANLGHWEYDCECNSSHWSDQLYRIFGLPPQHLPASYEAFLEKVHPEDRNFVNASHRDNINNQQGGDIQHRILTENGEERWVREVWKVECNTDGKPIRSLGIVHDINQAHTTLLNLQRERGMFTNGPVVTFTWENSEQWPVKQVSPSIVKLLGYSAEEIMKGSDHYAAYVHPDDLQRVQAEVANHSIPGIDNFIHQPYRLIHCNGNSVWVSDCTTLIRNPHGEITHYQGYLLDITKMIKMEKEIVATRECLGKTREMLIHTEKLAAIGRLSASIAHEFNNPLAGIRSVIEGVQKNYTFSEADQHLIDLALLECDRINNLTVNLQDFNRPSSSTKERIDIHLLLDEILILSTKDYQKANIKITTEYAAENMSVFIVRDQIKQVLLNLLTNARDALNGTGGTITIATEYLEREIIIRIKDTGCGIAKHDLEHIFEPFYTTKSSIKGTGLGLSVSHGIIQAHRGNILVESIPGKGTTFSVVLPVDEAN